MDQQLPNIALTLNTNVAVLQKVLEALSYLPFNQVSAIISDFQMQADMQVTNHLRLQAEQAAKDAKPGLTIVEKGSIPEVGPAV